MPSNYQTARNLRARVKTRVKDLRNSMQETTSQHVKERLQKQIKRLQRLASETRTYNTRTGKRMHTSKQVARGIEKLSRELEKFPLKTPKERNKSFEARMNIASSTEFQGPVQNPRRTVGEEMAGITHAEVQVFYRATQRAWQYAPVEKRTEAILNYYKTRDLEQLFNEVMENERNQAVPKALDIINDPQHYTEAQKRWAYETLQDNETEIRYVPLVVGAVMPNISPVAPL